jgi:hypothetical protein
VANSDKINVLIETIRYLNHEVRPRVTTASGGDEGLDQELRSVLANMRDNEHVVSRTIKLIAIGEMVFSDDESILLTEGLSARVLISDIATTRESLLSMIKDLPEDQWDESHSMSDGAVSITSLIDGLIESDRGVTEKLKQLEQVSS